jgi:hypothetical protein
MRFQVRNVASAANALILVVSFCEKIHNLQRWRGEIRATFFGDALSARPRSLRLARAHRCGRSGNRDAGTMGRGIASWQQGAVGQQSRAIDTNAEN